MSTAQIPSFKWAEDKQHVYVTIELGNVKDAKVEFDKQSVKFGGVSDKTQFALDLQLKKAIDPAKSTWAAKDRQVEILLEKESASKEFWQFLLQDKNAYKGKIKVDWDHWHDEDEEDFKPQFGNDFGMGGMGGMPGMGGMGGMGGMDFGGMGGMGGMDFGGMGGMGGMGDEGEGGDSDDDDLPGLENAEKDENGDADGEKADAHAAPEAKADDAKPAADS